jgi:hypothetical protein
MLDLSRIASAMGPLFLRKWKQKRFNFEERILSIGKQFSIYGRIDMVARSNKKQNNLEII